VNLDVRGCIDCPFAAELFGACEHPRSTKKNSLAVSGLYDGQLVKGAKPRTCPLRTEPITIALGKKRSKR
jgi:hypothetical protein